MKRYVVLFLVAVTSLAARANAEVEYCPALVHVAPVAVATPVPGATASPTTDFGLRLQAESARTVSGVVAMHAPDGWYQVSIPPTKLLPVVQTWRSSFSTYTRNVYESSPVYVRFAKPITVASAFMLQATTSGENVFGWDKRGTVPCDAEPDALDAPTAKPQPVPNSTDGLIHPNHEVEHAPPIGTPMIVSQRLSLQMPVCNVPFASARATKVAVPVYPPSLARDGDLTRREALIAVAISASGIVDDAWVFESSGRRAMDVSALQAAAASTYAPGRAFCQNVPGIYTFHADFYPN